MRAVGTVSAVYREPVVAADGARRQVSAGRHLPCHPLGRPAVTTRTSSGPSWRSRGGALPAGGRHEAADLGGSADSSPAPGPWGDGPGVEGQDGTTCAWHDAEPHREPSCRWTCWAVSRSGPPPGIRVTFAGRHAPALFALLVLVRRPRTREAIAADLWPESDTTSAGSLRQALWLVRHGLSDAGVPPDSVLEVSTRVDRHPRRREHRPRHRRVRGVPRRHWHAAPSGRSSCTAAISWNRSGTTASPPSASASPTATRTPSSPSPSDVSPTATFVARSRRRSASSRAIRSARRRTRS